MRRQYQFILVIISFINVIGLLIYRHEYNKLKFILEEWNSGNKLKETNENDRTTNKIDRELLVKVHKTPLFHQIDEKFYAFTSFLKNNLDENENITQIDSIVVGKARTEPIFHCHMWLENKVIPKVGKFSYKRISEPINDLCLYIFQCFIAKKSSKPKGVSYYISGPNINPLQAIINKVTEVNNTREVKDNTTIKAAICVMPNKIPIVPKKQFKEFMDYYNALGVNHFIVYDTMITKDMIQELNSLDGKGNIDMDLLPLNYPFTLDKSYDIVRDVLELDCIARYFGLNKEDVTHVVLLTWFEFLVSDAHFHNDMIQSIYFSDTERKSRTIEVKTSLLCLEHIEDDKVDIGYQDIMKNAYYYLSLNDTRPVYVRNIKTLLNFDNIYDLDETVVEAPTNVWKVIRYIDCVENEN